MTHPEPQGAPRETDLREESERDALVQVVTSAGWKFPTTYHPENPARLADAIFAAGYRRLARPDALREKVMAAFDDWWDENGGDVPTPIFRKIKAAVAAVLEEK
jgi:hypothetical protein